MDAEISDDGEDIDFDVSDELDQEDYFPFDDEPVLQFGAMPAAQGGGGGAGGAPLGANPNSNQPQLQPSSNLPLSSHLISSLNQNAMMHNQAALQANSHMTAYQFQVMQSQVLAQEVAMLNQNPNAAVATLSFIPGAAHSGGGLATGPFGGQLQHAPPGQPPTAPSGTGPWMSSWHPAGSPAGGVMFSVGAHGPGAAAFTPAQAQAAAQQMYGHMAAVKAGSHWDPSGSRDWDQTKASDLCLGRIARDLHSLYTDPIPGIMVHANENDVTRMQCLIKGPADTPYEGGFFQFYLRCPPDYPISNPRVKLLTTGGGTVRFNPNLYANGKVCLSLLGTWSGPQWSPALNISSLLLSIQSLMCDFPYKNEPGYERASNTSSEVVKYNVVIQHETIRVAVIESVKEALRTPADQGPTAPAGLQGAGDQNVATPTNHNLGLPASFRTMILRGFLDNFDRYLAVCSKNKSNSSTDMQTFLGDRHGKFKWDDLLKELGELRVRVLMEVDQMNRKNSSANDDADADEE
ncbi:Ubiquitin-conjugating enzyme E2 Z [Hypsibius exemplaris]|uniref:Ubiquitin-conjugating enzyme E2 Z n=1 Tax=Hypsibius exemplaris TaxID=2072580 RepID=A0A1W0WU64_HYPEX|nr:Ubiquitin-conjugating enzyme E2 Z [Hypsibius exemplaris]